MKKLLTLIITLVLVLSLSACSDYSLNTLEELQAELEELKNAPVAPEEPVAPVEEEPEHGSESVGLDSFNVMHWNPAGDDEQPVVILFQFKSMKFTKYQIAFISCT